MTQSKSSISQQKKPEGVRTPKNQPTTAAKSYSSSNQHVVTKTIGQESQYTTQEATENSEEANPSVLLLRGKVHVGNLLDSSLNDGATKNTMVPTGRLIVNGLKRQAGSISPLSSPISDNVQPPPKRPVVIANATLSKDKVSPSSPASNLYMQPSAHSATSAHVKPAVPHSEGLYLICSNSDIIDDTSFTTTAESDVFATKTNLSLNVCALKNEGETLHKAWEEFLKLKEDVKQQQQEILNSIQKMGRYIETFKAWSMKSGIDVIQQEIQEENPEAQKGTPPTKQQLSSNKRRKIRRCEGETRSKAVVKKSEGRFQLFLHYHRREKKAKEVVQFVRGNTQKTKIPLAMKKEITSTEHNASSDEEN
ncbi:unnamed protein product [Cylicostephanus goldi]|uniref:Uncharacterized protein n=1 Tax=Cylicostephanus goldi TaxID=71465 RepID=A0A3P6RD98_CYLGO|nr:unnamed protein product [Cylicostephanus goldi]